MKTIYLIICMFITVYSYAGEFFPEGCRPLVVQSERFELSTKKPVLIMVHNLSTMDVWVTHTDAFKSNGLSQRIKAGNWASLVLDKRSFFLSCIESRPGHEQLVGCRDVLAVCEWLKTSWPQHSKGTFWIGEDMSLSELSAYISRHGYVYSG